MRNLPLLLASFAVTAACRSEPELNLRVRTSNGSLVLTNRDSVAAHECIVSINADWKVQDVSLPPGTDVSLPLGEFTTDKGTRFNAITTKPQRIFVHCFKPTQRVAAFG